MTSVLGKLYHPGYLKIPAGRRGWVVFHFEGESRVWRLQALPPARQERAVRKGKAAIYKLLPEMESFRAALEPMCFSSSVSPFEVTLSSKSQEKRNGCLISEGPG